MGANFKLGALVAQVGALALAGLVASSMAGGPSQAASRAPAPDQLTVVTRFLGIGPNYAAADEKAEAKAQIERLRWESYHSRQSTPAMVMGRKSHPHRL